MWVLRGPWALMISLVDYEQVRYCIGAGRGVLEPWTLAKQQGMICKMQRTNCKMKTAKAKRTGETGFSGVIYRGPSLLDGSPIVAVALYSKRNRKTGGMVQTYILRDDMDPLTASKSGADVAICGTCPHRGTPTDDPKAKQAKGRTCYVILGQGVLSVWKALSRGLYPVADGRAIGRGRMVRIGTYGDPAAVPSHVWENLIADAEGWTAYSHQAGWRPDLAMQSADTYADALRFWKEGARTFRVVKALSEITAREILCPASKEAGKRTTCAACKLCAGTATRSPKSVAIVMH